MSTALEKFQEAKANYDRIVKELGSQIMADVFTPFWEAHPEVVAVRWTQYTPYFNDGDPCVFHVHELSDVRFAPGTPLPTGAYVSEEDDDYDDDDEEDEGENASGKVAAGSWYEAWNLGATWNDAKRGYDYEPLGLSIKELNEQLQEMEDILRDAFGDHVRITATRAAFDVAEYNHD